MISPLNPARHKDTRMRLHPSSVIFLLSGFVIMASFLIPTKLPNPSGDSGVQKLKNTTHQSIHLNKEVK